LLQNCQQGIAVSTSVFPRAVSTIAITGYGAIAEGFPTGLFATFSKRLGKTIEKQACRT
jgi:hypothetical protein